MTAYLMTRGTPRRLDYRFVGSGSPTRWWAPLQDWLVLEEPEVVVRGGPQGLCVLVSGIPSARRDIVRTIIRYTIVVDDAEPDLVARLAAAGLDPQTRAALGAALDAQFPAAWVDDALGDTPPTDDEIGARLQRVLDAAPGPPTATGAPARAATASWVGAADDPRAAGEFLRRVTDLAAGRAGWAFTTAGLSTVEGARKAAADLAEPVAVLLGDGALTEVIDLGKARAGQPAVTGMNQLTRGRSRTVPMILIGSVVLVLVVLAVVLGLPPLTPGAP